MCGPFCIAIDSVVALIVAIPGLMAFVLILFERYRKKKK